MSEQPKKRPWLQFHLSTAVVLMFVAAGLLWANMRGEEKETVEGYRVGSTDYIEFVYYEVRGWPFWFVSHGANFACRKDLAEQFQSTWRQMPSDNLSTVSKENSLGLAGDVLIALAALCATLVGCEYRIRRQERRP
jgi:hypothetical protein